MLKLINVKLLIILLFIILCSYIIVLHKHTMYLWVPQLTGYPQILAAASESIRLGRLASLPIAEVGLAVEGVLPCGLGYEPPEAVERVLPRD